MKLGVFLRMFAETRVSVLKERLLADSRLNSRALSISLWGQQAEWLSPAWAWDL